MPIQDTKNMFGKERATRYKAAMDRCPTARFLEIMPLLCLTAKSNLEAMDVVDIGSGTGYLADFFEGRAKSVLRVDKSAEMLAASGQPNILVADMVDCSPKIGLNRADLVTCLAAFHHSHVPEAPDYDKTYIYANTRLWGPEKHLDVVASLQQQYDAIKDWTRILKPGGVLCLVDIPGYPDSAWDRFRDEQKRHSIDSKGYYHSMLNRFEDWVAEPDTEVFARLFEDEWKSFLERDLHMKQIAELVQKETLSIKSLIDTYEISDEVLKKEGPMVPTDFFDEVIDGYGSQRHFGYFPRETSIREAFESMGMINIFTGTVPTPWLFNDKKEAAWFVHELFGLGEPWEFDSIPPIQLEELIGWLDQYLGFYTDKHKRVFLYWQLCYFYAEKPNHE